MSNRDILRSATRDAHVAAERAWLPDGHFTDQAQYMTWLLALWEVHDNLGRVAADALSNADFAMQETIRRTALREDLALNAVPPQSEGQAPSPGWAWGVLYALNGSALGASMLLKSNSVAADWPLSYLRTMQTYAQDGGLRSFFDQLNQERGKADDMICGANNVFRVMTDLTQDRSKSTVLAHT